MGGINGSIAERREPTSSPTARPPLWLAAGAVASGWSAAYTVLHWTASYILAPMHDDVRLAYAAATAGLRHGWSTIYDPAVSFSAPGAAPIDTVIRYDSTPFLAWLFAPLTVFSEPVAYALWTLLSLACLVFAWRVAAPFRGLAKITLLLVAIGLWPALLVFYFGQPTMIVLALVAAAWLFHVKERPVAAGVALALATFLKPQAVLLIPAALLVSGRYRAPATWAVGCALLAAATAIALGPSGVTSWWHVIRSVRDQSMNTEYTMVSLTGSGLLSYAVWGLLALAALLIARWRKHSLEVVFAVGLVGTAATASYFHPADYIILAPAAWFILRTSPPLWHRVWLLVGIIPMQVITLGAAGPLLVWEAAWLGVIAAGSAAQGLAADATRPAAGVRAGDSTRAELADAHAKMLQR